MTPDELTETPTSDCLAFGSDLHVGTSALLEKANEWLRARSEKVWTDVALAAHIAKHELFRQHKVEKARPNIPGQPRVNLYLGVGLVVNEAVLESFVTSSAHKITNR